MKRFELLARIKGMNLSKLAEKSKINRTSLYMLSRDKVEFWPGWKKRLAEALGWEGDPQALIDEVGEDD